MPVYFIQAGASGPVKIGKADDPPERLSFFQTGHYETLRLIRIFDGGLPQEAWLHRHFRSSRMRGEWHHFDPAMLTIVVPRIVPLSREVRPITDNATSRLVAALGGREAVARATGQAANSVSHWIKRDRIAGWHWIPLADLAESAGVNSITAISLVKQYSKGNKLRPDLATAAA